VKIPRISASLVLAFAFAVSLLSAPVPSRADQQTYMQDKTAYVNAGMNLDSRVKAVEPFLGSPTGLAAWVDDVTKLARTFDEASQSLWNIVYLDADRNHTSYCDTYDAQLDGSWGSKYGIVQVAEDYNARVGNLYSARSALENSESKLIEKLATAKAEHQPVDKLLNDQLNATRTALSKLDAVYNSMLARYNGLLNNVRATKDALQKPNCGQPPPPNKTVVVAKPTPTPTPTPAVNAPKPVVVPSGADKWDGTWISGKGFAGGGLNCGVNVADSHVAFKMRCTAQPQIGLPINFSTDVTLSCTLPNATALQAQCSMAGQWHETNYDANLSGPAALRFDVASNSIFAGWSVKQQTTRAVKVTTIWGLPQAWFGQGTTLHR